MKLLLLLTVESLLVGALTPIQAESPQVVLRNANLERVILTKPYPQTVRLVNRLSRETINLTSAEFRLDFDGGAFRLTAKDFQADPPKTEKLGSSGTRIALQLRHQQSGIAVQLCYELKTQDFYTRKWLVVDSPNHRLDWVEVEAFQTDRAPLTTAGIERGQPVFIGNQLFAGLEYPVGENLVSDKGEVALRHYPGRSGRIETRRAVIGISPGGSEEIVRAWFANYLNRERSRPVKRLVVWDDYFNGTDQQVEAMFDGAAKLFRDRKAPLDAVVMDGGWTDPRSVMKVSPERPQRLALVKRLAKETLGAELGLHVITSGARGTVDKTWLHDQGYDMVHYQPETNNGAYCLGDPRVAEELKRNLVSHVREYDVRTFKMDWAAFDCGQPGHHHLPDVNHGREACVDNYLDLLHALKQAKPSLFIYDAPCWHSPWWLLWYEAPFITGGDQNNSLVGPPSYTEYDLQMTWRDDCWRAFLWDSKIALPFTSVMTHDPDDWYLRPNEPWLRPLRALSDHVLISYLRGTQLTEIALKRLPTMPDEELDALAAIMRWAAARDDVLLADTQFIGGYPGKQEVYGYAHFAPNGHGIIGLRNPALWPQKAKVTFDASLGRSPEHPFALKVIYPFPWFESRLRRPGETWEVELQGHELLVAEVAEATTTPPTAPPPQRPRAEVREVKSEVAADERTLDFVASVPANVRAMLAVLVEGMPGQAQQQAVNGQLTISGQDVKLSRHANSQGHRFNYNTPWVLLHGDVPNGESRVHCRVVGVKPPIVEGKLIALPHRAGVQGLSVSAWLLLQAPPPAQTSELPVLPVRGSVEILPRKAEPVLRPASAGANAEIYAVKVGAQLYSDRPFAVVSMPKELEGLEALRFAHGPAKENCELHFVAKKPVRVYIVFGPRDASDQWLDPQPGWTVYPVGEFKASHPYIPPTIYFRDFPAGEITLFPGQGGNYVVLAIARAIEAEAAELKPTEVLAMTFDQQESDLVSDGSVFGNGALLHKAKLGPGHEGRALFCDGRASWATIPDAPELNPQTGLTIEAWLLLDAVGDSRTVISKGGAGEGAPGWGLRVNNGRLVGYLGQKDNWFTVSSAEPVRIGEWTHARFVWNGRTADLWTDEKQLASEPFSGPPPTSGAPVHIGQGGAGQCLFQGLIDEVRVTTFDAVATPPAEVRRNRREKTEQWRLGGFRAAVAQQYREFLQKRIVAYPPEQISKDFPKSREEWLRHAAWTRGRLWDDVFHLPRKRSPPAARICGRRVYDDYTVEAVVYDSEPGALVTANLYLPRTSSLVPALMLANGHGGCKTSDFNRYAGQLYAKAGLVVLTIDTIGTGERSVGGHHDEFVDEARSYGASIISKIVLDVIRGIDYLCTRPEVDKTKIACAGHSLGGTTTMYVAALDERVTLAMPCVGMSNFHYMLNSPSYCWRPPRLLLYANQPELVALAAPRCAYRILHGEFDEVCGPIAGLKATADLAKRVYTLLGVAGRFDLHIEPEGTHQAYFLSKPAMLWVAKHFGLPRVPRSELDNLAEVDPPWPNAQGLKCADLGVTLQPELPCVSESERHDPRYSMAGWMSKVKAASQPPARSAKTTEELQRRKRELTALLGKLLALPWPRGDGKAAELTSAPVTPPENARSVQELRFGAVGLTSYLVLPSNAASSCPAVVYLHRSRVKQGAMMSPLVAEWLKAGKTVLALDAVPTYHPTEFAGDDSDLLMGFCPTAVNVSYVQEAIDYLLSRGDVDAKHIACVGEVDDVALLAAVLDDRISEMAVHSRGGQEVVLDFRHEGIVPGLWRVTTYEELMAAVATKRMAESHGGS